MQSIFGWAARRIIQRRRRCLYQRACGQRKVRLWPPISGEFQEQGLRLKAISVNKATGLNESLPRRLHFGGWACACNVLVSHKLAFCSDSDVWPPRWSWVFASPDCCVALIFAEVEEEETAGTQATTQMTATQRSKVSALPDTVDKNVPLFPPSMDSLRCHCSSAGSVLCNESVA